MIGLDSNILLRAILDDGPVQSRAARATIDKLTPDHAGYINLVVLAEVTWTLRRRNKARAEDIAAVVSMLLRSSAYVVETHDLVASAVEIAKLGRYSFNDALIGLVNRHAGCMSTITFDRGAPLEAGFDIMS